MMRQSILSNFMEVKNYPIKFYNCCIGADLGYYYMNIYVGTPP